MISYTMINYVKLYYDILNYTLLRSLMSPMYLVNSTFWYAKNTKGREDHGPIYTYMTYIYIYIYT